MASYCTNSSRPGSPIFYFIIVQVHWYCRRFSLAARSLKSPSYISLPFVQWPVWPGWQRVGDDRCRRKQHRNVHDTSTTWRRHREKYCCWLIAGTRKPFGNGLILCNSGVSAAIYISNHDVASSGRQDRYNRKRVVGRDVSSCWGWRRLWGGNISQRRLLAFPFRYPSPYLWTKQWWFCLSAHPFRLLFKRLVSDGQTKSIGLQWMALCHETN